ncbi:hypothetical protein NEOLEDRAFT_1184572, partial [Neolentinus lepideus HHB14362 ss-1]
PSLRAAIQEVADALARRDFEEPAAAYTLVGLVPIDGSAAVCAVREWDLPWSLVVMPPSTEELPPPAEEVPPVAEEEEVVVPVATRTSKGKGKAKAVEESHLML